MCTHYFTNTYTFYTHTSKIVYIERKKISLITFKTPWFHKNPFSARWSIIIVLQTPYVLETSSTMASVQILVSHGAAVRTIPWPFESIILFQRFNWILPFDADEDEEPRCVTLTPRHKAAIRFIRKVRCCKLLLNHHFINFYLPKNFSYVLMWPFTNKLLLPWY